MAASAAKMAQHSYSGHTKYGSIPLDNNGADMMVDNELHLKMSKKIAQLTKVIYSLNTKHDEHDEIVKMIQQQHSREIESLNDTMKRKIEAYDSKLTLEKELRDKVTTLESKADKLVQRNQHVVKEFGDLQHDSDLRIQGLKEEHQFRVEHLNKELSDIQNKFSVQMSRYEQIVLNLERNKDEALSQLKAQHKLELENALAQQSLLTNSSSSELEALKALHESQLQDAESRIESLRQDILKMKAEHEDNLMKAQLFYQKELEALQHSKDSSAEEQADLWKEKHNKLVKELHFQEAAQKKESEKYLIKIEALESESKGLSELCQQNAKTIQTKDEHLSSTSKQLESVTIEMDEVMRDKRSIECEVTVLQERLSSQSQDIQNKSKLLSDMEGEALLQKSSIQRLEEEMKRLTKRLKVMESEKENLTSKTMTEAEQQGRQVQILQQELDDTRDEMRALQEKYEKEQKELLLKHSDEFSQLREQHDKTSEEMRQRHHSEMSSALEALKADHAKAVELLQASFEKTRSEMDQLYQTEKASLESQLESMKRKVEDSEEEIASLRKMMQDRESGLGAATTELEHLQNQAKVLQQRLDEATAANNAYKSQTGSLENQIANLKREQSRLVDSHEKEMKHRLAELNKELDSNWLNKLRTEVQLVRQSLSDEHKQDKAAALSHLTEVKDCHLAKVEQESRQTIALLRNTIKELESSLAASKQGANEIEHQLQRKHLEEIEKLRSDLQKEIDSLKSQLKEEERIHAETLAKMSKDWEAKIEEETFDMKKKYLKEKEATMHSHQMAQELLRREMDDRKSQAISELSKSHQKIMVDMETQLQEKHQEQVKAMESANQRQLMAVKMEMQRVVELKKEKEKELELRMSEFNTDLKAKDDHIICLEKEISRLEKKIASLTADIDTKAKEVVSIRKESSETLRRKEKEMLMEKEQELKMLKDQFAADAQLMLEEFNKAQDILKNKISTLQLLLEEAETRYRNRESREEDLEMIEHLQAELNQRLQQMNQLLDDKRYFQMELVNRETNFNKVFTAGQQHVGVINPLAKKKKGEKGPTKYTAAAGPGAPLNLVAGGSPKLRPIAGSPIHDDRINPNHVLPPMQNFAKKFVQ